MFDDERLRPIVDHEYLRAVLTATSTSPSTVRALLRLCFAASLTADESRHPRVGVVLADPAEPHWSAGNSIQVEPVKLDQRELSKVAQAVDGRQCRLLVRPTLESDADFVVWGIEVARMSEWHLRTGMSTHATHTGGDHLAIEIAGPGLLNVGSDSVRARMLALRGDEILHQDASQLIFMLLNDPLWAPEFFTPNNIANKSGWARIVNLMLWSILERRHGGAVLVLAGSGPPQLDIRYRSAGALFSLVERYEGVGTAEAVRNGAVVSASTEPSQTDSDVIGFLTDSEAAAQYRLRETLEGVARLAAVDGALLFSPDLRVLGFGTIVQDIKRMNHHALQGPTGVKFDPATRGTRHRSAAAFCAQHPGSAAFVVSVDGGIRAMLSHDGIVTTWEVEL